MNTTHVSLDDLIKATIRTWVENTDWEEEKIIQRVATALEVPVSRVVDCLEEMDF